MIKFMKCLIALSIGIALVVTVTAGAPAQKKIVLRTHHMWEATFIPVQKKFDREFMAKHPNIQIKMSNATDWGHAIEKYLIQAAAGTLPDVFYIHFSWAQELIRRRTLVNLQPYIDKDKEFDMEDFYSVAFAPDKLRGDIYIVPYDAGTIALFYNKDMFDKAGASYPDWPWTLESEFLGTCKKLTRDTTGDGKINQWGFYHGAGHNETLNGVWLRSFGGRSVNEDETECLLAEPASIKGLKWWTDLVLKHHVQPTPVQAGAVIEPFGFGKVGMTFGGSWMLERWIKLGEFEADVAPVPKGPAGRFTLIAGSGYGIPMTTKYFEEAWTYLKDYLSSEGQIFMWGKTGRGSPTRRSAWASFEEAWKGLNVGVFKELIPYSTYAQPYSPPAARVNDIIIRELELVLLGKKRVEEAARTIKAKVDPLLEENKKWVVTR